MMKQQTEQNLTRKPTRGSGLEGRLKPKEIAEMISGRLENYQPPALL
jgi:hypothetical protein